MKLSDLIVLLLKEEVTYGLDPTPVAGTDAVLAYSPKLVPMEGQEAERRRALPYFSNAQRFPTGLFQTLTFETDLIGNPAVGTAPAWAPIMRSVGMAQTLNAAVSAVFNPVSTGHKSSTIWFWQDGILHKLSGARGSAKLKINVHGLPKLEWSFTGLFSQPTDTANAVPVLTAWPEPQVANFEQTPTFTINGVAAVAQDFELDFGNKVSFRNRVNSRRVDILGRDAMANTTIDAEPLATLNPFTLAANQTSFAVNLVHGVGAGKVTTVNMPNCRLMRPEGYTDSDSRLDWPLKIVPLPTAGNDEFTITCT